MTFVESDKVLKGKGRVRLAQGKPSNCSFLTDTMPLALALAHIYGDLTDYKRNLYLRKTRGAHLKSPNELRSPEVNKRSFKKKERGG